MYVHGQVVWVGEEGGPTRALPQYGIQLLLRLVVVLRLVLLRRRLPLSAAAHGRDALQRLLLPLLVVPSAGALVRVAAGDRVDVGRALLLGGLARVVGGGLDARPDAVCVALLGGFDILFGLQRFLRFDVEGGGAGLRGGARHVEDGDEGDEEEEPVEAHSALGRHGGERASGWVGGWTRSGWQATKDGQQRQRDCCGRARGSDVCAYVRKNGQAGSFCWLSMTEVQEGLSLVVWWWRLGCGG